MLEGLDFQLWLLRLGLLWRLPMHSFRFFLLGGCGYAWGLLVGLDFWLWLWVSCALFFWIFCVFVGGVDGSGIWVCRRWWRWNWVWVWVSCSLCRVMQVGEEDSWKWLISGLHHFGKRWTKKLWYVIRFCYQTKFLEFLSNSGVWVMSYGFWVWVMSYDYWIMKIESCLNQTSP